MKRKDWGSQRKDRMVRAWIFWTGFVISGAAFAYAIHGGQWTMGVVVVLILGASAAVMSVVE